MATNANLFRSVYEFYSLFYNQSHSDKKLFKKKGGGGLGLGDSSRNSLRNCNLLFYFCKRCKTCAEPADIFRHGG